MRRPICILLLASVFAWEAGTAEARPPELRDLVDAPDPAGCSEYRFLLWNFYRAELWSDAQALPGATFDVTELLERLLEEQAGDGGFAELSASGPAARTTQTFDAMLGIVRLCSALDDS